MRRSYFRLSRKRNDYNSLKHISEYEIMWTELIDHEDSSWKYSKVPSWFAYHHALCTLARQTLKASAEVEDEQESRDLGSLVIQNEGITERVKVKKVKKYSQNMHVYLACMPLDSVVIVKVPQMAGAEQALRKEEYFLKRLQDVAGLIFHSLFLSSEGIPSLKLSGWVDESGTGHSVYGICTEYVGDSLYILRNHLDKAQLGDIFCQIVRILKEVHARGNPFFFELIE